MRNQTKEGSAASKLLLRRSPPLLGRHAQSPAHRRAEMTLARKACVGGNVSKSLIAFRQQLPGGGKSLVHDEAVRRDSETVLEQPKEVKSTDAGSRREVVQRDVFSQSLLHDIEDPGLLGRSQPAALAYARAP